MRKKLLLIAALLTSGAWFAIAGEQTANKAAADADVPPAVVKTVALETATVAQKQDGIANILSPETLVQLDADIRTAAIAADFSRREFERYRSTKSLSIHIIEGAERQSQTADAQLASLQLRLRQTWGDAAPFLEDEPRAKLIEELTRGKTVLVRLDFLQSRREPPQNVHVLPLNGGSETTVRTLWPAPTGNAAMPGISFLGLVDAGPGLRHLDRARAVADAGAAQTGVIIPQSALIVTAGETWCYIEVAAERFERRKVALTSPVAEGYLVQDGFEPGTRVVVRGASTLLSREAEPGDDEEDDGGAKTKAKPKATDETPVSAKSGVDDAEPAVAAQDKATSPGQDAQDDDDAKPAAKKRKTSEAPVTGSTSTGSPARAE